VLFFSMSTGVLTVVVLPIILGATITGLLLGTRASRKSEGAREPFAVLQTTLLGFMGLVLAFGLSLAISRYEDRRAAVVEEANAIGTSYLRAQTIIEPLRTESLELFKPYTDLSIRIGQTLPGSDDQMRAAAASSGLQRKLWALGTEALNQAPEANAPTLYLESLNETFDSQSRRIYGLGNRVPTAVLLLEIVGAAIALGAFALHLGTLGNSAVSVVLAALLVTGLLTVTFDLDRPVRGLITVPQTPLVAVRASMNLPPSAGPGVTTTQH
jgi:hypothetical protein